MLLDILPKKRKMQGIQVHQRVNVILMNLISIVAARGIFSSAVATGVLGFATAILFLFCTPDLDTLFSLEAPQPFVQIYALALGKGGAVFMTILAILGLCLVSKHPMAEIPKKRASQYGNRIRASPSLLLLD
jgi:hypothetical protein